MDFDDYQLVDANGDALTAKSWSRLTKQTSDSVIKIKAEFLSTDQSSVLSTDISSHSDSTSATSLSVRSPNDKRQKADDQAFVGIKKVSSIASEYGTFPRIAYLLIFFLVLIFG